MKRLLQILLIASCVASPCFAQSPPKGQWQLFGGYSYMRANGNLNGWEASITENLKRWFGGTLDASGHYGSPRIAGIQTNEHVYSILYGPHFFHPGKRWRPFAHVLVGVTHISRDVPSLGPTISNTSFAAVPGGGLDMRLFSRGSIRLFQADYLHANLIGSSQNQLRASAGIVLDLNKK